MAARLTCYHEAAHIVCAWYFGFDIVGACVLSDSNFRRGLRDRFGKALKGAAGHMEYRRQTFLGRDRVARNGASTLMPYAESRLAVILAGPIMTALLMDESLSYAFAQGGVDDYKSARAVREYVGFGAKIPGKIIESTALFLRSKAASKAVFEMARRLESFGSVYRAQIEMICRQAFKLRCDVDPCAGVGLSGYHDCKRKLLDQLRHRSLLPVSNDPLPPNDADYIWRYRAPMKTARSRQKTGPCLILPACRWPATQGHGWPARTAAHRGARRPAKSWVPREPVRRVAASEARHKLPPSFRALAPGAWHRPWLAEGSQHVVTWRNFTVAGGHNIGGKYADEHEASQVARHQ